MMQRKDLETHVRALVEARAAVDALLREAVEEMQSAEKDRRPDGPRAAAMLDKASRARVAIAGAIDAVREAFGAAGIRPA